MHRSRQESRARLQEARTALEQRLPSFIVSQANVERALIDLYAYLVTRFTSTNQFRKSFIRSFDYYLVEAINSHLKNKVGDHCILNINDVESTLKKILRKIEPNLDRRYEAEIQKKIKYYHQVLDAEQPLILTNILIKHMGKFFYEEILIESDEANDMEFRDNFFLSISQLRSPWFPTIEAQRRSDGRDVVSHPLGSRSVSITRPSESDPSEDVPQIARTTVFMQQGGPGSSHHFNPTNDQATQALGAWEIEGENRHHFVGGTVSFNGRHAEHQLIDLFVKELNNNPQLIRSLDPASSKSIVLHLFISKSPCRENCIPILKDFLQRYPTVKIHFYLQQWYESNDFGQMVANTREFLVQMTPFVQRNQVAYQYLPLATSAHSLYAQHRLDRGKSPFHPMPPEMVEAIYDFYTHGVGVDKIRDDFALTSRRKVLWDKALMMAQGTLPSDSPPHDTASAGACAAASAAAAPATPLRMAASCYRGLFSAALPAEFPTEVEMKSDSEEEPVDLDNFDNALDDIAADDEHVRPAAPGR